MNLPTEGLIYTWTIVHDDPDLLDEAVANATRELARSYRRVLSVTFTTARDKDDFGNGPEWVVRYAVCLLCHNPTWTPADGD